MFKYFYVLVLPIKIFNYKITSVVIHGYKINKWTFYNYFKMHKSIIVKVHNFSTSERTTIYIFVYFILVCFLCKDENNHTVILYSFIKSQSFPHAFKNP